ncbi:hypothetical protein L596_028464 [Steinernema carpocapsae]|uniref:SH2 domain-containing protein n=1 Tax=Steinernema carpocapsae TaxID=34508 RepID=A0A4U5LYJ2_STECR|nr:hypothetical protein L596_028464 [Steinernema carpocapsae]
MSTHPHSPLFLSESRSVAMWKMSDFTQPPSPRNNEALIERESRKREDQAEEELRVNPWFHGRIPKDEAEDLLQFDGQFLVRFAKDKTDGVVKTVLSSLWNGTHSHFLIREQMGLFGIEESQFETIPSLIEFHQMRQVSAPRHLFSNWAFPETPNPPLRSANHQAGPQENAESGKEVAGPLRPQAGRSRRDHLHAVLLKPF